MERPELFWNAPLEEIKKGYHEDQPAGEYLCLICGARFTKGIIYPFDQVLMDAEKAVATHIEREHGSVFECLLRIDKKVTGLTDLQRELLAHFYRGESDQAIVSALGIGSPSTIRNHRFALREREKQARVFLAIMELLGQRLTEQKGSPEKEEAETGGPLKVFPRKEKKRMAVLETAAGRFEAGRKYGESEVNRILESVCDDYGTLRRYLVDRGFLEREQDGSSYWVKTRMAHKEPEMKDINKKELKFQYKHTPRPMGVYQIKNNANGKVLVASSLNLDSRQNRFQFEVKNGSISNNRQMKQEWAHDGAESFSFEVLEQLEPSDDMQHDYRDELADLEKKWLEKLQPYGERGYNRLPEKH
jgi:hypothetical protein